MNLKDIDDHSDITENLIDMKNNCGIQMEFSDDSLEHCNNNNLWNIHIIIPCRRSFSVLVIISGVSPYTNRCLFILF